MALTFLLGIYLGLAPSARAQSGIAVEPSAQTSAPLIIGTKVAPPFVIRDENGGYGGISIELWQTLAQRLNLQYELRELSITGLLQGLETGELDAAVGAVTLTAEREAQVDFSHPFHTTGLAIAVPTKSGPIWSTVKRLFSWEFLAVLAGLGGLLLIVGFVFWLAERRQNQAMFGGTPAKGIGSSFWWAAVTMTTVGYGDKAPITLAGRVVALIWMFAAIIIISSFTAAIATSLTVSQLETAVKGSEDLPEVRVATVKDSASVTYLVERNIGYAGYADLPGALAALAQGQVDAVVHDKPILQYLANQEYPRRTTVLPGTLERQDYAIALPAGSGLREPLNRALLQIISEPEWTQVLKEYLGEEN